jgi:hypothetical protein
MFFAAPLADTRAHEAAPIAYAGQRGNCTRLRSIMQMPAAAPLCKSLITM